MSRVIPNKNAFTSFEGQFISFLRRKENKTDTQKHEEGNNQKNDHADECMEKEQQQRRME